MKFHQLIELKKMALRNLARHKVKTIITCTAIMISVALYIWMQSWINGMTVESRRNIINYEIGAAKLQTKLYFAKKDEAPAYESFSGWKNYAHVLDNAGYHTAPRYTFSGTVYSVDASTPLVVYAVDPEAEERTLNYANYVDFGRYIKAGEFGIVLGAMTAEKLKTGIPTRIEKDELNALIAQTAQNADDADFINSCYISIEAKEYAAKRGKDRYVIKRAISAAEKERLWSILDSSGRNDVRISTVIDFKMAPENIRKDKWDADVWPLLNTEERAVISSCYEYDELMDAYLLKEEFEEQNSNNAELDKALAAMLRVDYSGAVRHVNQVIDAKVVGVINSPDPATNFNVGYMPLDVLQGEEGMMLDGSVTELLIRDKKMNAAGLTSKIEDKIVIRAALDSGLAAEGKTLPAELEVFSWMDYMQDYLGYEQYESAATKIFSFLLFFLALIGISNTMLLAILERTKEIGMMRALGMTNGQMIAAYMIEAAALGFIGSVLGIILGCILNYPMVKNGWDFSEMLEKMGGNIGYRIAGNFRGMWDITTIFGSAIAATLLSSLMAFFPTRRAVKMPITESLRFE